MFRLRHILVLITLWTLPALRAAYNEGQPASDNASHGGRVGWARLITPDPEWQRHSRSDSALADFIHDQTSLNLDRTWYSADPAKLNELCRYPLIFSTGLAPLTDPAARANLAEYLKRGGFLLVDSCINRDLTPDPDVFLAANTAVFARLIQGSTVRPLRSDHRIYNCYFKLTERPPHTYHDAVYNPVWARHPLYGVYVDEQLHAIISLSGLQCGWDHMVAPQGHARDCMEMVVNIYVNAMTTAN